jgi:hypothetical protein
VYGTQTCSSSAWYLHHAVLVASMQQAQCVVSFTGHHPSSSNMLRGAVVSSESPPRKFCVSFHWSPSICVEQWYLRNLHHASSVCRCTGHYPLSSCRGPGCPACRSMEYACALAFEFETHMCYCHCDAVAVFESHTYEHIAPT